jgi:hypothetical protein
MSFFTRRGAAPATCDSRLEVIRRADNEPLLSCCRHLADRALRTELDPTLRRRLAVVTIEFDRVLAEPELNRLIRSGEQPWPVAAPQLLSLLLAAAGAALTKNPSLTGLIADTVLRARRGSRAAWRLRALAHEQWGDLSSAIDAHEEYLALIDADADRLGVRARVRGLRELEQARSGLESALAEAADDGIRLPQPGADDLLDLLSRPTRQDALDPVLEEFVSDLTQMPVPALVELRDVLHSAVRCTRTAALRPGPMPPADVQQLIVLRIGDLRGWLAGRSICLVANDKVCDGTTTDGTTTDGRRRAADGEGGVGIDSYDLVARFAPFRIDPVSTGSRTDLLIIGHDQPTGWDQPTDVRLVLAEDPRDWVQSIRRNLVPGAQRALLDKTLRRPARQPAFVGDDTSPSPSNAFHLVRLLDQLDVSPSIDLIGFALDRFAEDEREWLRSHAHRVSERRISLR